MKLLNSLFKMYSYIFVVTWKMKSDECRVIIANEKEAKILFSNLKSKNDTAHLYKWTSDNQVLEVA